MTAGSGDDRVGELLASILTTSSGSGPALRVGLVLDSKRVPAATAAIVDDLLASSFVEVVDVRFTGRSGPPRTRSLPTTLWRLYRRLDERRANLRDDPLREVDVADRLAAVGASAAEGDGTSLDVVLDLSSRTPVGTTDVPARFGTWTLRYATPERPVSDPPYAWETIERTDVAGATLIRVADSSASASLVLASAAVANDSGSVARNRVAPMYGAGHLVARTLRDLHAFGWEDLAARATPAAGVDRVAAQPGNLRVLRWLAPQVAGKAVRIAAARIRPSDPMEYWQTAVRLRPTDGPAAPDALDLDMKDFRWLEAPRGHLYADPFPIERNGGAWLFLEDYPLAEGRAVISCAPLAPDGRVGAAEVVLRSEGHLSFPHVFEDDGEAYLLPESSAAAVIRLHRATDFPRGWQPVADLLPIPGLDTTVFRHAGRWWLFTTVREPRGGAYLLLLFTSAELTGPWRSHPRNPVSSDVRVARGGGAVFHAGDDLIRPSQDCSRTYGYAFGLNEIVRLTESDFEERPRVTVDPSWSRGLVGTHTYNRSERFEAVDGKVIRSRREVL